MLGLNGCHLLSPPDSALPELTEVSSHPQSEKVPLRARCALPTHPSKPQSIFTAWWEGEWQLDTSGLSQLLTQELERHPEAIGASLAQAFTLKAYAQQAELLIDGRVFKLATTPLPEERGARFVGAQREVFIWCEKGRAYWRVESGELFPLLRASDAS